MTPSAPDSSPGAADEGRTRLESPSQTAGPYVHIGLVPNLAGIPAFGGVDPGASVARGPVDGEPITVRVRVVDGAGETLRDALVESWQADARGLFASPEETRGAADPNFVGWARRAADPETGELVLDTIRPGRVPWHDGRPQAPHLTLWIVARGINLGLHTRVYFADETEANAEDPVLALIDPPERAGTLIAQREADGAFRFDVHLQGEAETVFLDV